MGHQKAAFEIITKTFDLKTVMQTSVSRACANWYMRFDNFVALMGGFPTDLPREWFSTRSDWYTSQIAAEPHLCCTFDTFPKRISLTTPASLNQSKV